MLTCTLAAAVTPWTVSAAVAVAKPLEQGRAVETWSSTDECQGVPFTGEGETRLAYVFVAQGKDGIPHWKASVHGTDTFTNLLTGRTLTNVYNGSDRDHKITDNGDGTLTILVQLAGSSRWLDAEGAPLFADTGRLAFELLVHHNGTPTDPFDDGAAEFLGFVTDHTGRNDTAGRDWCTDFLAVTR